MKLHFTEAQLIRLKKIEYEISVTRPRPLKYGRISTEISVVANDFAKKKK